MIGYIIIVVILTLYISFRWKYRKLIQLSKVLKSDILSLPLLGIAYIFFGDDEGRMKAVERIGRETLKQGGIISVWMAHRLFVVLADPELAEYVSKHMLEKDDSLQCIRRFMGNANFVAPVHVWRPRRKQISQMFGSKYLAHFVDVFAERSELLNAQVGSNLGKPTPILDLFMGFTIDSINKTAFRIQHKLEKSEEHDIFLGLHQAMQLMSDRLTKPWLYSDFIYNLTPQSKILKKNQEKGLNYINKTVKLHRTATSREDSRKDDSFKTFMELMLNMGYSDVELREEALTLTIGGTYPTAIELSFVACMLAKYPDWQEMIYDELKETFTDTKIRVTAGDLPYLKHLEAFIKETIRLYPVAPVLLRKVDKDLTLPSGLILPEGCGVMIHVHAINRNPECWGSDAEEFRPERFLDTNLKHPSQFATFGLGPRNCVGYQYAMLAMKTVLATLLRQYRLLPAKDPDQPLRLKLGVMVRGADNSPVIVEART